MTEFKNFIFFRATDIEALEPDDLIEATEVYFIQAKGIEDALGFFEDAVVLSVEDIKEYRVAEMPIGIKMSRRLSVSE